MKKIIGIILALALLAAPVFAAPPAYGPAPASTTQPGTTERCTDAETTTGSATDCATTPANITARFSVSDYLFFSVDAGIDGGTAPTAAVVTSSTNKAVTRGFSGVADNDLFFVWQPPADWNGGTILFRVIGFVTNGTAPANTETVIFGLQGASVADSQLLSSALGTIVNATFTANATYAQYDRWSTAWSTAVTLTGAAAGETVLLNLLRDVDDTYGQTIGVAGLEIKYTRTIVP